MNYKQSILIALLLTFFLNACANDAETSAQPNIVIIVADDLGWGDVGFNGSTEITTPNLDKLATEGIRFTSLYAMQFCTPARAALMTGRYPMRYGLQTFAITPGQDFGLSIDESTLPEFLREQGYRTYALGKWHLGHGDQAYWPNNRGFDYFQGTAMGEVDFYTKERFGVLDWQRNGKRLDDDEYLTSLITKDAVRIIEEQSADQPFFLYLAHLAVHAPYQAPQEYIDRFSHIEDETRRIYAAMAYALDLSVGEVMGALEQKGLRENTLVLFLSDNGGITEFSETVAKAKGMKPAPADNGPFRGSKGSLYEGGVRSAAVISWPGHIPSGEDTDEPVHVVDFLPTFAGLIGAGLPSEKPLDGLDIWPVLTEGQSSPHEDILINAEFHRGAIRRDRWKLVKTAALPSRVELYDLKADPGESTDLSEAHPDIVAELEMRLNAYAAESSPSLFFREYMPFIKYDSANAEIYYDEDEGQ